MGRLFKLTLLVAICVKTSHAMIMRNNALMSKMVSHFQKDNNLSVDQISRNTPKPNVINLMQTVLCRNFPSIPCEMITRDETLRKLIQRSIQQISHKKLAMEKTTPSPGYHLTLFPIVNSEDLSHYLEVSDTGHYSNGKKSLGKKKQKKSIQSLNQHSGEKFTKKKSKNKKESKRTALNSRKRIRKFYPHKIKYKDKNIKIGQDFRDNTEEKLSMSVEIPDMVIPKKHNRLNYKMEPSDPPVWRIDYMKHGEPNINVFGYESDRLKGKLIKAGPNVIVDKPVMEQVARRDVLHPDLYIKNNYVRKNNDNSDTME